MHVRVSSIRAVRGGASPILADVSMRVQRLIRYSVAWVAVAAAVAGGLGFAALRLSLAGDGEWGVKRLTAPVTVTADRFGVPVITAGSRPDAFRALGYVTARDRLFQMDVLRRRSAGRLAEIFGEAAVSADTEQRVFGFEGVAGQVARRLPAGQREALQAYADGVNGAIGNMVVAPFEFLLLGYRLERWRVEDSLLIVLGMFETLSQSEWEERMLSVMERALPSEVYRFLTPETDQYTHAAWERTIRTPSVTVMPTAIVPTGSQNVFVPWIGSGRRTCSSSSSIPRPGSMGFTAISHSAC